MPLPHRREVVLMMSVFEALSLMITFGLFIIALLEFLSKKKITTLLAQGGYKFFK
ncbi:Putative Holin-like Toxin (Hol-Tox) [Caldicoprobacter faecalis]|uniref:Putative Holin-like Toxin (Hol-Tox) n=1 Tax=Caldicoprobacter faecalis TaxID=937334 RepID=A0A1I5RVS4_9FIRM|nr:Putative Holin-like Toxin (Hol-Tox) [Caldicoprobacter faecalis]